MWARPTISVMQLWIYIHCSFEATGHDRWFFIPGGTMEEIRFHGRGGQGTVMASKVLAVAIAMEEK